MAMKYTIEDMQALAIKKGGECLSDQYVNNNTKLLWRCSKGHEWKTAPTSILNRRTWCPTCAGKVKKTIEEMKAYAISKGGECLSDQYINNNSKLLWKCSEGHKWRTSPTTIFHKGTWCPTCAGLAKLTIEQMKELAISRGGECLSNEYKNIRTKLQWKCSKGHKWEANPIGLIHSDSWCPACAGMKKHTIARMKELAASKGGRCLSAEYKNCYTKLRWECAEGHEWKSKPKNILSGSWCPKCTGLTKLTIEEMKEIAISRGGECLSDEYINQLSKLKWKCAKGHEWEAAPAHIKNSHAWCPECIIEKSGNTKGELITTKILCQTGRDFVKVRPKWLRSEKGRCMELDSFCEERKIAVEYNGNLHYKYIPFFHESKNHFLVTRKRDSIKRKVCAEQGIILIQLREVPNPTEERVRAALVEYCIRNAVPLELNPEYAEMLSLPNYGLDSEA